MPRPTDGQILNALNRIMWNLPVGEPAQAVMRVINEAWDADEAERERGRNALALIETYGLRHHSLCAWHNGKKCCCGRDDALSALRAGEPQQHDVMCGPHCDCGVDALANAAMADAAMASVRESVPAKPLGAATWEYAEEGQVECFNELQRIRREVYATALGELGYIAMGAPDVRAATRYPLKKRVPATVDDPHGHGQWCAVAGDTFLWRLHSQGSWYSTPLPTVNPARVRALYALLENPYAIEDDVSVDEEALSA